MLAPHIGLCFSDTSDLRLVPGSNARSDQSAIFLTSPFAPSITLTQGRDDRLYGTASGHAFDAGIVFVMTTAGTATLLHAFTGGLDGAGPMGLIQATDGNLYGTTSGGGAFGAGVVFRLNPRSAPVAPATARIAAGAENGTQVTWSASAGATHYTIKRSTRSGAEVMLASGLVGTTFIDTATTKGQRYYYLVTAMNTFGESVA